MMQKYFIGIACSLIIANTAYAQDCSKLEPKDVDYLKSLSNLDYFTCKDGNIEIVLSHQFGEAVPLKSISISKKDFKKSVTISGNILSINGEKLDASRVAVYDPPCKYETSSGANLESGRLVPLSCNNQMPFLNVHQDKDFGLVLKEYEKISSPLYKKAVSSCKDKAKSLITQKVEEYVIKNGGKLIFVKERKDVATVTRKDGNLLNWMNFDVEIIKDQKRVGLSLSYPLLDSSELHFSSPSHDAFGEIIPHSERSAVVKVKITNTPSNEMWYDLNIGTEQKLNGNTAMLANTKTKTKLLEIDFANFSCVDEIVFNQNSSGPEVSNSLSRNNPKDNLDNKEKKEAKSKSASAQ